MTTAFRTSSFTLGSHQLVYDDYGEGQRLVVYLHAVLIDSEINRGIAQALAARGNRVVLLDLLGHGRSDKPTHASAYRIDSYADQLFGLLDELDAEQAVLGGVSLGANVSLFAASRQPRRVRGWCSRCRCSNGPYLRRRCSSFRSCSSCTTPADPWGGSPRACDRSPRLPPDP